jgi:hypothetical protein
MQELAPEEWASDGGVLLTYREHSLTKSHHDDVEPTAAISRIGSLGRTAGEWVNTSERSGQAGSKGRALLFLVSKQNLKASSWCIWGAWVIQHHKWDFSDGMKPNPTPGQGSGFIVFFSSHTLTFNRQFCFSFPNPLPTYFLLFPSFLSPLPFLAHNFFFFYRWDLFIFLSLVFLLSLFLLFVFCFV